MEKWLTSFAFMDGQGVLHFDLVRACIAFGALPTARNQTLMESLVTEVLGEQYPDTEIVTVDVITNN